MSLWPFVFTDYLLLYVKLFGLFFVDNYDDTVPSKSQVSRVSQHVNGKKQGEEQKQTDMKKTLKSIIVFNPSGMHEFIHAGGNQSSHDTLISHQCLDNKTDDILYVCVMFE